MTTQFQDWTEGLAALRERAEEVRGTVEDGRNRFAHLRPRRSARVMIEIDSHRFAD